MEQEVNPHKQLIAAHQWLDTGVGMSAWSHGYWNIGKFSPAEW